MEEKKIANTNLQYLHIYFTLKNKQKNNYQEQKMKQVKNNNNTSQQKQLQILCHPMKPF